MQPENDEELKPVWLTASVHKFQWKVIFHPVTSCSPCASPPPCSAFKACHPHVLMFYFAAETHEDMNL